MWNVENFLLLTRKEISFQTITKSFRLQLFIDVCVCFYSNFSFSLQINILRSLWLSRYNAKLVATRMTKMLSQYKINCNFKSINCLCRKSFLQSSIFQNSVDCDYYLLHLDNWWTLYKLTPSNARNSLPFFCVKNTQHNPSSS